MRNVQTVYLRPKLMPQPKSPQIKRLINATVNQMSPQLIEILHRL